MDTITKGRLGYNLLEKELLKRDYEIYIPLLENTKIDCIACKNGQLIKMQIKTIQMDRGYKKLPVRKISHNQGQYKIFNYTSDEIDYFIGVDIDTEDLYIVPIDIIEKYKSAISVSTLEYYKNNFDHMEPQIGNILSGCDDIGETLTGNTEGME
jgi:hypothetical protein